jgi:pyruvate/2-oxoglutarate dehydrogenase complex dihydrolipoamide dehydrogenase (E3) component
MAAERSYDALIIGAGQAAKPLAMVLAKAGLKTALVEEKNVGGACVNYG